MLSLFGREARRFPVVRSLARPSVDSALAGPRARCQSRLFGKSDLCIYGCDGPSSRREVHHEVGGGGGGGGGGGEGAKRAVHCLPPAWTAWEAWRWSSPVGKWEESAFSLKVAETLQGVKQATTDLLNPWCSLTAPSRALPFAIPGIGQPALYPQSLENSQGYEEGEEEMRGLFEGGLWAASVRRKRVTKMRKHKWRKRRKLERQSASRRVKK